jgi:hypothetical protein
MVPGLIRSVQALEVSLQSFHCNVRVNACLRFHPKIYLDEFFWIGVLQLIAQSGEFLWENVEPEPAARIYAFPAGFEELDALRACLFIDQRGAFDDAVSDHSIKEVLEKGDHSFTAYSLEILDYWRTISAAWPSQASDKARAPRLDGGAFGYLSERTGEPGSRRGQLRLPRLPRD